MDSTQLLLSTAVTITTVLLILVSLQLISLLRQLKSHDHAVKKPDNQNYKVIKKKANLNSLLEKIKILSPYNHSSKKKFFKSI